MCIRDRDKIMMKAAEAEFDDAQATEAESTDAAEAVEE